MLHPAGIGLVDGNRARGNSRPAAAGAMLNARIRLLEHAYLAGPETTAMIDMACAVDRPDVLDLFKFDQQDG